MIVTYILPTAKGALARQLVNEHGLTQVEVSRLFGVTSAAISQYIKGTRGGNELIDKSAYRDDFYEYISSMASEIMLGLPVSEALCNICDYVKSNGLLRALYVYEGYSPDKLDVFECPRIILRSDSE
jgi:hypothetical protein